MSLPRRHPLIAALLLARRPGAGPTLAVRAAKAGRGAARAQRRLSARAPPARPSRAPGAARAAHAARPRREGLARSEAERRARSRRAAAASCASTPSPSRELAAINAIRTVAPDRAARSAEARRVRRRGARAQPARAGRARVRRRAPTGAWSRRARARCVNDDPDYDEVNSSAWPTSTAASANFAHDAANDRLFAAGGKGGVWQSDRPRRQLALDRRRPADAGRRRGRPGRRPDGGTRPCSPDRRQRLRRRHVYAGPRRLPHDRRRRDLDARDRRARRRARLQDRGRPDQPDNVYAATGVGLFRSTDARRDASPTSTCRPARGRAPARASRTAPTPKDCFLANMVTDVVVQAPRRHDRRAQAGAVLAAVGWRAGTSAEPRRHRRSRPNNGIYRSTPARPARSRSSTRRAGFSTPLARRADAGRDRPHRAGHRRRRRSRTTTTSTRSSRTPSKFNGERRRASTCPTSDPAERPPADTLPQRHLRLRRLRQTWTADGRRRSSCRPRRAARRCVGVCSAHRATARASRPGTTSGSSPTRRGRRRAASRRGSRSASRRSGRTSASRPRRHAAGRRRPRSRSSAATTAATTCQAARRTRPARLPDANRGRRRRDDDAPRPARRHLRAGRRAAASTLVVGNDGGVYTQHVDAGDELRQRQAGAAATRPGFNTLQPYDAAMAKDGTVYTGLQDNGEMKIDARRQAVRRCSAATACFTRGRPRQQRHRLRGVHGGDMAATTDGGKTWTDIDRRPTTALQFINAVRDGPERRQPPDHRRARRRGDDRRARRRPTRRRPGRRSTTSAPSAGGDADARRRPTDVRSASTSVGVARACRPARKTAGLRQRRRTATERPGARRRDRRLRAPSRPAPTRTTPFTIGPDDGDAADAPSSVDVDDPNDDWDLFVYHKEADGSLDAGRPLGTAAPDPRRSRSRTRSPATTSSASSTSPPTGHVSTLHGDVHAAHGRRAGGKRQRAPTSASAATATRSPRARRSPTASPPTSAATSRASR